MLNIAVFASGSGTNAENLINYFKHSELCKVSVVISNKKDAFVLKRAEKLGVPTVVLPYRTFVEDNEQLLSLMNEYSIDIILLAGFLLKIPESLIKKYPGRILNIHPALLPKFGGKGMFGDNVHRAVLDSGESESGITIHMVDENYDNGHIIFQSKCKVSPDDTVETLAAKIHLLEQASYPEVVEVFAHTLRELPFHHKS